MLRGEQGYPNCGFVGQLVGITSWQAGEGDGREEEEGRATMICYPTYPHLPPAVPGHWYHVPGTTLVAPTCAAHM